MKFIFHCLQSIVSVIFFCLMFQRPQREKRLNINLRIS